MLYTTDEIVQHVVVCIGREADIANSSKILFNYCLSHRLLREGGREWGGISDEIRRFGFSTFKTGRQQQGLTNHVIIISKLSIRQ